MTITIALSDGVDATYDVTECAACLALTAIIVQPHVYVCMGCGGTGTPGWVSVADVNPNEAARKLAAIAHDSSRVVQEFTRWCRQHAKRLERERLQRRA